MSNIKQTILNDLNYWLLNHLSTATTSCDPVDPDKVKEDMLDAINLLEGHELKNITQEASVKIIED